MTAEVPNVLAQIAVIQHEIIRPEDNTPVVSFENVPYTINVADMPLFVNYVGPLAQVAVVGSDELGRDFSETRNYSMTFYHSPYGAGVEGEKIGLLTPYFPLVYAKFGSYPHLKSLGGVLDSKLVADSGTRVVKFAGHDYYGTVFTLQVTSKVRRLLADNE